MQIVRRLAPLLLCALAAACAGADADAASAAAAGDRPASHVDSIVPVEVALERFRAGLQPVDTLSGGARSRDALVSRWVRAVEEADSAAIAEMTLDGAEFAWLYYPHTRHTSGPYEMDPSLLWFLIRQNGEKGITRVVRRHGGRPLGFVGYGCRDTALVEGPNRVWDGCVLRYRPSESDTVVSRRLFGSVLERDGRFKFVSYANDL